MQSSAPLSQGKLLHTSCPVPLCDFTGFLLDRVAADITLKTNKEKSVTGMSSYVMSLEMSISDLKIEVVAFDLFQHLQHSSVGIVFVYYDLANYDLHLTIETWFAETHNLEILSRHKYICTRRATGNLRAYIKGKHRWSGWNFS